MIRLADALLNNREALAELQRLREQRETWAAWRRDERRRAQAIAIWYAISALAFFALVVAAIWLAKGGVQ